MNRELLLHYVRDHSLEDGRAYLQEHIEELSDHTRIGEWLADEALRLLYTPLLSLKIAELLIFFGEYVQHHSSHALGLKAKGNVLFQIGHYEAALKDLDAAGEEFLSLGDGGNWARSRISWVLSAGRLGRVDDALKSAEQARTVFSRLGEYYWVGVIDNNTAMIYSSIGRYRDALKLYDTMLTIFSTVTDQSERVIQRSIAITQQNQGVSLSWLGDFEQASTLLQQAQANCIALKETALVNSVEIDLADLDYTQGYYGSALRRYYQAYDGMIQEHVDNPVLLAEVRLRIANCLVKLDRAQEACLSSEEAVKSYQQTGISLSTGNALREHATVLVASNRLKAALVALDEAQALFYYGGFEPHVHAVRLQQAEIFLQMGSFATAATQAQTVKQYCDAQGLVVRSIQASLLIASTLIANARQTELRREKVQQTTLLQEATSLCKQVILQARHHNLQEEIYKGHYLLGGIASLQNNLSQAAKHYRAAIAQIERILGDLVYDLSPSFLRTTWTVYEDMIALCLQQSQPEEAFYYLEQARSMALRQHLSRSGAALTKNEQNRKSNSATALRTQSELRNWQERHRKYSTLLADSDPSLSPTLNREIIQAELKHCEEKLNELFERLYLYEASSLVSSRGSRSRKAREPEQARVQRINIAQVRLHLSADHLLLSYYMHQGKLVIFAITAGDMLVHEQPDGQDQLEHLLLVLHAHLQAQGRFGASHSQKVIHRLLKKLYDLLIYPVAPLLPSPSGYLTIVPYGPLHKLPFHALYDGSRFLIEDYQVNYLPANSLLTHLDRQSTKQNEHSTPAERAAGPPLVLGYSHNGYLQCVFDEARTVASLLGGNCYLEEEATIERLIQQAPSSPIIHLATHGQSRLDAPNFSYVRLAGGQLNALDAFSLNLEHCELVTLSGCETGLALSGGGDEQLGLGRAFLAGGASSLVISLWSVEDNATNELMQRFYQHLLQGESRVQALRSAQCSLLHQTDSMYAHPFFWAAFRLIGAAGPLRYRNDQKL